MTGTRLGTPLTMAPEMIEGKNYSSKTDLWSIGMNLNVIFLRFLIFKKIKKFFLYNLIILLFINKLILLIFRYYCLSIIIWKLPIFWNDNERII